MTIGALPWARIRETAEQLAREGGADVRADSERLDQLAVTGPAEIYRVSRQRTRKGGAGLMSSGGTTGRPKLTYVAYHQAAERLLREWQPLRPGNLLLNLFTPGRMWASHYYMQSLAERVGCDVIPAGPYRPDEITDWLPVFQEAGVDALAGNPTALADFAQGVLDAGETLNVKTLIWMAEPWTPAKEEVVRAAFPGVGFWGNYGSVETWVMATNTPDCDLRTLHLMADQVMEPDPEGALLTRAGDGWTLPTVRYRLGDRVAAADCRCGRPDALQVLGRADDSIKLHGALVGIGETLAVVASHPGVEEAQLVLTPENESRKAVSRLAVRFTGSAEPAAVRDRLLRQFYDLGVIDQHHPGAISVDRTADLDRVARTNKVPPMIWSNG